MGPPHIAVAPEPFFAKSGSVADCWRTVFEVVRLSADSQTTIYQKLVRRITISLMNVIGKEYNNLCFKISFLRTS
jgi:hypothetical protein